MTPRGIVFGLLAAVAVVVCGAPLPATAAQASSGYIYVQYSPDMSPESNVGSLSVVIASSSPLTSMTVSLEQYSTGTDVLDLPLSDFTVPANDGNGQYGTWTLTSPITTSQLALGRYDVFLTATDSGGDSAFAGAGELYFQDILQFPTFTSNGTTFDYDHQDVTFSGMATLLVPGGTPMPFANQPLLLAGSFLSATTPVTTDSSGAFTVTATAWPQTYGMRYGGTQQGIVDSASAPTISISTTLSTVTIKAALAATQVNENAPDSVSGTVTYTLNGVTKPLTGHAISLYAGYQTQTPTATTVTDGSGNFTMPVPTSVPGDEYWTVATSSSQFLWAELVTLHLIAAQPNALTGFQAKLSSFAIVTYSGCITGADGPVRLDYAAKPTGPWRRLRLMSYAWTSRCTQGSAQGFAFRGRAIAKLAAAYYRADYYATPNWQGAVSGAVFLRKDLTKITSFSVTPHSVARNGDITVSGRLWAANNAGKWHAYGHRRVIVILRYNGVYYRYRRALTTAASGWFSGVFRAPVSAPYFAQYNGDPTHFACASVRVRVTIPAATALSLALRAARQVLVPMIWPAAPRMPA